MSNKVKLSKLLRNSSPISVTIDKGFAVADPKVHKEGMYTVFSFCKGFLIGFLNQISSKPHSGPSVM